MAFRALLDLDQSRAADAGRGEASGQGVFTALQAILSVEWEVLVDGALEALLDGEVLAHHEEHFLESDEESLGVRSGPTVPAEPLEARSLLANRLRGERDVPTRFLDLRRRRGHR